MYMPVMMRTVSRHFFGRNDTSFECFTANMFKLDRRMADMEVIFQDVVQIHQDARAL
jgi:hypothetical protein